MPILGSLKRFWNAFRNYEEMRKVGGSPSGQSSFYSNARFRLQYSNERSIIASIYTRLAIDVSSCDFRHVLLDEKGRYKQDADSLLNSCFSLASNQDQSPRAFRQEIAMTIFDKGSAAIVPIDTTEDPDINEDFDISTLRVGEIVDWYPRDIRVNLYNIDSGQREQVILPKKYVAIVENPLYYVMNEPNSTLQRLVRKLNLLDVVDEQSNSGKLDLIIQLPYVIKSETRRHEAEKRRQDVEFQLKGSQYGIAYVDGTEKVIQLNRPAENNLLKQIEFLTKLLYTQLGLTEEIMNGTADEQTMINYSNRTIEPLITAILEAMQKAFIGKRRFSSGERIKFFQNPFRFVTANAMAEISDKLSRNRILTANEIRGFMGLEPSSDPNADKLINSNMPQPVEDKQSN